MSKPAVKSLAVIADEVIAGKWGNGQERIDRLTAAGYNPREVQLLVNAKSKSAPVKGQMIKLTNEPIYANSSTSKVSTKKTGIYYFYDGQKVNGRYRITNKESNCGKKPVVLYVTGWIKR